MAIQAYARNGELLEPQINVSDVKLTSIGLVNPPSGLVDIDVEAGLVKVVETPNTKPITMRLGRLLKKLNYEEKIIRESGEKLAACKLALKSTLKFARTEEEILTVYENGPHSCMKNCDSVRIYASDDLAVAYIEVGGKVVSRSVVCVNESIGRQYVRAYGFVQPIIKLLEEQGFKEGDLEGCTLQKIEEYGKVLAPYLDGCTRIDEYDDYLEVSCTGEYRADRTDGYLSKPACEHCDELVSCEYDLIFSEHLHIHMCESCFDEVHVRVNDEWYHIEDEDVVETEYDGWQMRDEWEYVEERSEWHPKDVCIYNNYSEEWILKSDLDL